MKRIIIMIFGLCSFFVLTACSTDGLNKYAEVIKEENGYRIVGDYIQETLEIVNLKEIYENEKDQSYMVDEEISYKIRKTKVKSDVYFIDNGKKVDAGKGKVQIYQINYTFISKEGIRKSQTKLAIKVVAIKVNFIVVSPNYIMPTSY